MQTDAGDTVTADVEVSSALNDAWAKVMSWAEGFIEALPSIVAALLVLTIFFFVAKLVRRAVERLLGRISRQRDVNRVIAGAAFAAVLVAGLFVALGIMGLDKTVTSLLAGAGILGLALGFAFQDTAENFIAGIILNIRDEFTDGDIIMTNEFMGTVERVEIRATWVRTFQGQLVVVPNSKVFKNPLINYTALGSRRVDLAVGVSYGDDLERAKRIAIGAVETIEARDKDRPVELFYGEFGSSSINFEIRFWVPFNRQTDFLSARSDAIVAIKRAFDEQDVTIPFPIRTLDFSKVGGVELKDAMPTQNRVA